MPSNNDKENPEGYYALIVHLENGKKKKKGSGDSEDQATNQKQSKLVYITPDSKYWCPEAQRAPLENVLFSWLEKALLEYKQGNTEQPR